MITSTAVLKSVSYKASSVLTIHFFFSVIICPQLGVANTHEKKKNTKKQQLFAGQFLSVLCEARVCMVRSNNLVSSSDGECEPARLLLVLPLPAMSPRWVIPQCYPDGVSSAWMCLNLCLASNWCNATLWVQHIFHLYTCRKIHDFFFFFKDCK